jgi:hypothetical protein
MQLTDGAGRGRLLVVGSCIVEWPSSRPTPPLSSKQTTFQSTDPDWAGEAETVKVICEGRRKVPLV